MENIRVLNNRKRIALVAHDNKKKDLTEWVIANKAELLRHELLATGTTGRLMHLNSQESAKAVVNITLSTNW